MGNYERRTGKKSEVVDLAAAAASDPAAQQAFTEFGQHLGVVIRTLLAEFHADVIVLGGGISRSANLFLPAVQAEIGDSTTPVARLGAQGQSRARRLWRGSLPHANGSPDPGKSTPVQNAAL